MQLNWRWHGSTTSETAATIEARRGGRIWISEDVGEGSELYAILHRIRGSPEPVWEHSGYSPYVAIIGDRCFTLEAKNTLVYWRLVSWEASTGKDKQIHYEEKDYRYNLSLVRAGPDGGFLVRQSGSKQDAFDINKKGELRVLEGLTTQSRRFVFGSNPGEYLVWTEEKKQWRPSEEIIRHTRRTPIKFPSFRQAIPEVLDTDRDLLVTRWMGKRTLWKIRGKTQVLWEGYGSILIDPWDGPWVRIIQPGSSVLWWRYTKNTMPPPSFSTLKEHYTVSVRTVKSTDGTVIPYILTKLREGSNCKGLLVVGYGAYGISTTLTTARWEPLLKRGMAVAIGLWRGGGDHTPEWEDDGRLRGRTKVLEDAEAVVRDAQRIVKVHANRTWMYGRSAGGLWVGGLIAKYPNGELAGGGYMEVPYLDVLRTVTNRSLPLTEIETDEFGLPEQRMSDFWEVLNWSPMETLLVGGKGTPGVSQIVRTGLNDSEVLAYESVKWITRCRNGNKKQPIYLAVESDQGHFVPGSIGTTQKAEDLAILLELMNL
jgi:hypothetical protein